MPIPCTRRIAPFAEIAQERFDIGADIIGGSKEGSREALGDFPHRRLAIAGLQDLDTDLVNLEDALGGEKHPTVARAIVAQAHTARQTRDESVMSRAPAVTIPAPA